MKLLLKGLFKTLWIILKYTLKLSLVVLVFFMEVIADTKLKETDPYLGEDDPDPGESDRQSRQREFDRTGRDPAGFNPSENNKPLNTNPLRERI